MSNLICQNAAVRRFSATIYQQIGRRSVPQKMVGNAANITCRTSYRSYYSSLYEATCAPTQIMNNNDEYVARHFGYRVVLSFPTSSSSSSVSCDESFDDIGNTESTESIMMGSNYDIISSPEIQQILSSKNKSVRSMQVPSDDDRTATHSAAASIPPKEAYIDNEGSELNRMLATNVDDYDVAIE